MMETALEDPIPTRLSLLSRLKDWGDEDSWKDFFDTYWRLIYSVALKAGLTDAESQDVVQETIIIVAKEIGKFKRDPARGSFKAWLRTITQHRIVDQFRKRRGVSLQPEGTDDRARWQEVERIPDPSTTMQELWDQEWRANLWSKAIQRVKLKVKDEHYQMFDLYYVKQWPVRKVARVLCVSVATVYFARHRVSGLIKAEVVRLEKDGF